MKKKINIVFEESRFGGPQNHFCKINKELKKKYVLSYFINKDNSSIFFKKLKQTKVKTKKFSINFLEKGLLKILLYVFFFIPDIFKIKNLINEDNPDLIHIVGGVFSLKTFIAATLTKKKIIWHITDSQSPYILKIFFYFFYKKCLGLIFASKKSKDYYLGNSSFKYSIIPSPINIKSKKKKYQFQSKITIGTSCNISKVKGLELFLMIAKKLQKFGNKKIYYEIHGNVFSSQKKYYEKLKYLIKLKNINNLSFKKKYDKAENILKKFDIYISTSKSESSPTALWEAMGYGLPILATDVGDIKNIFKDYNNILDSNNFEKSLLLIVNLLQKKNLRKKLGVFSRNYAKRNFNFKNVANKQILYYSTIIK